MFFITNNGSTYYRLSCGIPSDVGIDVRSNTGSKYLNLSANDFILWGQATTYPQVSSNTGSQYYFLKCAVPSDVGLDLQSNSGTRYYYTSSFNCVSFCA